MENKSGNNGFVSAAVVILSLLLFARTADVLSYFAPTILNMMVGADVSWLYGGVTAFFVEGVALAFHFDNRAQRHVPAQIVKWVLLAVSGLCQVFDGNIITDTMSQMSEPMKFAFQWGVPLLPLFVVVLLFFVGKLPENDKKSDFHGIKHILPDIKKLWDDGTVNAPASRIESSVLSQDVRQVKKIAGKNGKHPETEEIDANP